MSQQPSRKKKLVPALITLTLVLGGIGYLFYSSAGEAFEYYKHVDEVTANPGPWMGKHLQLHGFVVPGSIERRLDRQHQEIEYRFTAVNCGATMQVHYAGTVPDTFKDRAEVVLTGKLVDATHFDATQVSAKCPSKYKQAVDAPQVTMCTRGDTNVAPSDTKQAKAY